MSDPLASTTLSYAAYAEIPADGQRWESLDGEVLNDAEIVQPDVVVARRGQVSGRGIEGTPLLLVEAVSPTRPGLDREVTAKRYAANGVQQFWLADPVARTVECVRLVDGRYVRLAAGSGTESLAVAPGPSPDLGRFWLP